MKKRAILVGINHYEMLGRLEFGRPDAESFADALTAYCGFDRREIQLLTCAGQGAAKAFSRNVERALLEVAGEKDLELVVFGFWGHGFRATADRHFLCGLDTSEDDLERSAVPLDLVKTKLSQAGAKDTIILLDCCQRVPASPGRAGAARTLERGATDALDAVARDVIACHAASVAAPTVALLMACSEGQSAYEWNERGHGILTALVLDAMQNGLSRISELSMFLSEEVPRAARRCWNKEQVPYCRIEGARGDITFRREGGLIPNRIRPAVQKNAGPVPGKMPASRTPPLRAIGDAGSALAAMNEWTSHLGVQPRVTDSFGFEFVFVPPGMITLKDEGSGGGASRAYEEKIDRAFMILRQPPEPAMLRRLCLQAADTGSAILKAAFNSNEFLAPSGKGVAISAEEILALCDYLSQQTNQVYRLPTELEWHLAFECAQWREMANRIVSLPDTPSFPSAEWTCSPFAPYRARKYATVLARNLKASLAVHYPVNHGRTNAGNRVRLSNTAFRIVKELFIE